MVQNSSHSPQGAFGHLLSLIKPRPRLTVATHFPTSNDTVACALKSVKAHCPWVEFDSWNHGGNPQGNFAWSFDHMVLRVTKNNITQLRGVTSDFEWTPTVNLPSGTPNIPKYHDDEGNGDPYAQIDTSTAIPACEDGKCNYRTDGY
jgi:ribonuclease Z